LGKGGSIVFGGKVSWGMELAGASAIGSAIGSAFDSETGGSTDNTEAASTGTPETSKG